MKSKRKKKVSNSKSLLSTSFIESDNQKSKQEDLSSEDEYLPLKYPADDKYLEFLKNFKISSQEKREAGVSNKESEEDGQKCSVCVSKFNKLTYSILCSCCKKWFCFKCALVTKSKALDIKKQNLSWSCQKCKNEETRCSQEEKSKLTLLEMENSLLKKVIFEMNEKLDYLTEKIEIFEKANANLNINKLDIQIKEILEILHNKNCIKNENHLYSSVVKKSNNSDGDLQNNVPVLIIKPKKKQSSKQTKEEVQKKINPVSIKATVKSVKEIQNGGIVIKGNTKEEVQKLKQKSEEELIQNYNVYIPKLKQPRLVLIGSRKNYTTKELIDEMKTLKYINESDNLEIKYSRKSKYTNKFIIYIETKANTFKKLVNKVISLGWDKCTLKEDFNIIICYTCLR